MKFRGLFIKTFSLVLASSIFLVGCGKEESKSKKELLGDSSDKQVKVVVLTQSKERDKVSFDTAESKVSEVDYSASIGIKPANKIERITIPDNIEESKSKDDMKKIIDGIEKDKDVNVVVFSSKDYPLSNYARDLKKNRQDIFTISASTNDSVKDLYSSYDLSLKADEKYYPKKAVDRARSMGAERFLYLFTDKSDSNRYAEMLEEARKFGMPIDKVDIKSVGDQKRIDANREIDRYIGKYSNKINVYSDDSDLDEVIMTKLVRSKFYVAEFSKPNSSLKLAEIYGIVTPFRMKYNFSTINSMIQNYYVSNYNIERMVGSVSFDPEYFLINMACEIGINIKAKGFEISKAYNSYYLEKLANVKLLTSSGFINVDGGRGKVKLVVADDLVY